MTRESARTVALPVLLSRDTARLATTAVLPPERFHQTDPLQPPERIHEAVAWLCRTHEATGRRGSSKGFSLLHGWLPAYPETTGYVIGTLLDYAARGPGRDALVQRAREMGDWECRIQETDGGIMQGQIGTVPRRSIVFNTGQVLHGWIDLEEAGHSGYDEAAARAARLLTDELRADGTWNPAVQYSGLAHTYDSRVAWAMLRWAERAGDDSVSDAARRQLDWVCTRQQANGWFADCVFKAATIPSTHAIAYTLRGLLESYAIAGDERWLDAVLRTSEVLIRKLEVMSRLVSDFDEGWRPTSLHSCLTGTVQLGGVWLRLYQVTGDARWLNAGLKATEQAAARQETSHWRPIRGALAGSFPVWGRYAPLQYPNWATKFLADSLMLHGDCLAAASR